MRTIEYPSVMLRANNPDGTTQEVGFQWFVRSLLNADQRFNATGNGIRSAVRIERALEAKGTLALEEEDWKLLRDAAEHPSTGSYPLSPARSLAPYIEAIESAK